MSLQASLAAYDEACRAQARIHAGSSGEEEEEEEDHSYTYPPATEEDIQQLRDAFNEPLPGDYAEFMRLSNGLRFPDKENWYNMLCTVEEEVQWLRDPGDEEENLRDSLATRWEDESENGDEYEGAEIGDDADDQEVEGVKVEILRVVKCGGAEESFFWVKTTTSGHPPRWRISRCVDYAGDPLFNSIQDLLTWYTENLLLPN